MNNDNYIGIDIIFLDLSDAFDSVCHLRLLRKLQNYGISGKFLKILSDIFDNRKQKVKFEDIFSEEIDVYSGCLQGCVLSPTLFNIYTADIIKYVKSHLFHLCR